VSAGQRRAGRRAGRGREEILSGAARVIAERGADATRFTDVASETGTAVSTLQYSFGNRDDLIIAALRHTNEVIKAEVKQVIADVDDPVERMRRFIHTTMVGDEGPQAAREAWLLWIEYWRSGAHDQELRAEWYVVYDQWKAILLPIVEDGRSAGVFAAEPSLEDVVTLLLAMFDGLCVPMVLGHASVPPSRADALALTAASRILGCSALATNVPHARLRDG
jgi:AcrR family transcriptional regulator